MKGKSFDLIAVRKELHRIPEPAFQEVKTKALLLSYLQMLPDIVIYELQQSTGILIEYRHGKGSFLLFRADMDALPLKEETGCDFASEHEGFMHACGHDVHMTVLLGLIQAVVTERWQKNLLFLFQPAEEGKGGAEAVLREGLLQAYKIKAVFALHVSGRLPVGEISAKAGLFFAIPQEFDVRFTGVAAHAAFPEKGKNALNAGVEFYKRINDYIAKLQPAQKIIFNIGVMRSGSIRNIIPDECLLQGTHRTLSKEVRDDINRKTRQIAEKIAQKHGVQFDVDFLCTYDPVINDDRLYRSLKQVCKELKLNFTESDVWMTGEDFGFFTTLYPGLLFWLGGGEQPFDLHSPHFLPDENCIPIGISVFLKLAEKINS